MEKVDTTTTAQPRLSVAKPTSTEIATPSAKNTTWNLKSVARLRIIWGRRITHEVDRLKNKGRFFRG